MKTSRLRYQAYFVLLFFCFESVLSQVTYERVFNDLSFTFPVELQFLSTSSSPERVFVVEQEGRLRIFPKKDNVLANELTTFLDITDRVRFRNGQELGLLGLAFHPQFESNGYFYVYYTTDSPVQDIDVRMVLSRFSVDPNNPNLADPDSELVLFRVDKNQRNSNHNGGKIAFGPDGYLYISIGDGGGSNDPENNGQTTSNVFGTICRIDIDVDGNNPLETNPDEPNGRYEIPSDNPFLENNNGLEEIYAYGIRNTWKFSFDPPTGRLWGADVGQGAYEEVNLIVNGANYGWSRFEGNIIANNNVTIDGEVTFPVHVYDRDLGDRSITGGYVYRGSEITSLEPDISDKYIFGDYVSGRVWVLNYNQTDNSGTSELLFKTDGQFISSFGLDNSGELYFSDYGTEAGIYQLTNGDNTPSGTAVDGIGEWQILGNGVSGTVQAVATSENGKVYVGGSFRQAGNSVVNNIAVYDSETGWSSLGSGANGSVSSIAIGTNGDVYAGGAFSSIGDISASNIARWDGSAWNTVGNGIEGSVAAITIDNSGNLYAGGSFTTLNGNEVRNIARWNGTEWSGLMDQNTSETGLNNEVRALAVDNDNLLYVGGNFDEAGGRAANRIATWNGTNWGTLSNGTSGFVEAIATRDDAIFIGGNFALADNQTVNRIVKWNKNTNSWSSLANGLNNNVRDILIDEDNIYACGSFSLAFNTNETIIVNNIARFNESDQEWLPLGTNTDVGVDILINDMDFSKETNGRIFAGGNFTNAGVTNAKNVALWVSEEILSTPDEIRDYISHPYPNPTNSEIKLKESLHWVINDINGRQLDKGKSNMIPLQKYDKGTYLITLRKDENKSTTFKIVRN